MPSMERQEPIDAAQSLVSERFPTAIAAFLAGSVLTSRRTSTSDLDIVVLLSGPPAPYRETLRVKGWIVELFVQTPTSLRYYWNKETEAGRAPLMRMCAESHVLTTSGNAAADVQTEARKRLASGPPPVLPETLSHRRYVLTALLDDFRGATDPAELVYIACALLNSASEIVLLSESSWLGSGKLLGRLLTEVDAGLVDRLANGQRELMRSGDKDPLELAVIEALDRAGGPLAEGYRVDGDDLRQLTEIVREKSRLNVAPYLADIDGAGGTG